MPRSQEYVRDYTAKLESVIARPASGLVIDGAIASSGSPAAASLARVASGGRPVTMYETSRSAASLTSLGGGSGSDLNLGGSGMGLTASAAGQLLARAVSKVQGHAGRVHGGPPTLPV